MKKELKRTTIGMMAKHPNMNKSCIVSVEFYQTAQGIELHAISGYNLARIRGIATVLISNEEYNDRPYDAYDSTVEYDWAMAKVGFEFEECYS